MSFSDFLEVAVLNHFFKNSSQSSPAAVYVALFTADPTDTGSLAAEISGNAYARVAVTWDTAGPTDGQIANSAQVAFPTASGSWGTITHFAIMDAASAGNMLVSAALNASVAVASGQRPVFDAAALTVTLS